MVEKTAFLLEKGRIEKTIKFPSQGFYFLKNVYVTSQKHTKFSWHVLTTDCRGVNPGGDGGTRPPPQFLDWGDEYLIVPSIFSYVQ